MLMNADNLICVFYSYLVITVGCLLAVSQKLTMLYTQTKSRNMGRSLEVCMFVNL